MFVAATWSAPKVPTYLTWVSTYLGLISRDFLGPNSKEFSDGLTCSGAKMRNNIREHDLSKSENGTQEQLDHHNVLCSSSKMA